MLGVRNANNYGGPAMDYQDALGQLDDGYARWTDGVRGLGQDGLGVPCGPAEGPFVEHPMAALVRTSPARSSTTAQRSRCYVTCTSTARPVHTDAI